MESRTLVVATVLLVVLAAIPFGVTPSAEGSAAVSWGATKTTGVPETTGARAESTNLVLPRAQAFYSQYRYVIGYFGLTTLVASLQTTQGREYGSLLSLYVTDFSDTDPGVSAAGYLTAPQNSSPGWVRAQDAYFVVNSSARIPTRDQTIVPFSKRSDADAFAREYGGTVERWPTVRRLSVGRATRTPAAWNAVVSNRTNQTNRTVKGVRAQLDRPVSRTVGETNQSLQAIIRRAPPNTTVRLPPGTYTVSNLTIQKPLTIRGAGVNQTTIRGDGAGSVITVTGNRTALTNLSITGVGQVRSGKNRSVEDIPVPKRSIKYNFWKVHGFGDAAVVFDSASRGLVADVRINTTSNGVIARSSPNVVVSNTTIFGTKRWRDGFLGVAALGDRVIVQDSRIYGGKVGVFTTDADRVVVRNTTMEGMMVGVFDLYATRLLIAQNNIQDTWNAVYIETRSYGSAVVGNTLANSTNGVLVSGRSNFIARNRLIHNRNGMVVRGQFSVYHRNLVASNRVGARALTLFPTNRVTANDFVANDAYATTPRFNILHVWRENYWRGAPGVDVDGDGTLRRSFRPTGPVDGRMADTQGAPTLGRSPALILLRSLQQLVPGLQGAGVLDPAPRAGPVRNVSRVIQRNHGAGQRYDSDTWDFRE